MLLCKSASGAMSKTEIANAKWLIARGANINAKNDSVAAGCDVNHNGERGTVLHERSRIGIRPASPICCRRAPTPA
jgi:hypothetical protein